MEGYTRVSVVSVLCCVCCVCCVCVCVLCVCVVCEGLSVLCTVYQFKKSFISFEKLFLLDEKRS